MKLHKTFQIKVLCTFDLVSVSVNSKAEKFAGNISEENSLGRQFLQNLITLGSVAYL